MLRAVAVGMRAVQLKTFGGIDVLDIVDVPKPQAQAGEVVVRVVAAGTNPGEISIREGYLKDRFPMPFPFGQGTDFAGIVDTLGNGVSGVAVGEAVVGWTDKRGAQAEFVAVPAEQVIPKPIALDFYRGAGLFVAATTAVAAVRAVDPKPGETVAVTGAAGGVGVFAVQLARRTGARVIGITSDAHVAFLHSVGVEHVAYGDGLADRLREASPTIDSFVDLFGGGYVDLALELGVAKERINTIIDFAAAAKHGVKTDGSAEAASRETLSRIAGMVAWGDILMPIAAIYLLGKLHDAYEELGKRKTRGKIIIAIEPSPLVTTPLHPSLCNTF